MLVQFSLGNFRSFNSVKTFSMLSSSIKEMRSDNTFKLGKNHFLKNAIIYGANSSGKTNLIRGMFFLKLLIRSSFSDFEVGEKMPTEPFLFSTKTEDAPSLFEIIFIKNDYRFRYGFEVNKEGVVSEWLFRSYIKAKRESESKLFTRKKQKIEVGSYFKEGKDFEKRVKKNTLFISLLAHMNGEISTEILNYFLDFNVLSGLDDYRYGGYTRKKFKDPKFKNDIMNFVKMANGDIKDIIIEETKDKSIFLKDTSVPEEIKKKIADDKDFLATRMQSVHKKYNHEKKSFDDNVLLDWEDNESDGTKKMFNIAGPILDTLNKGKVLVIDELDTSLHPIITRFIVELFNSKKANPKNAQLIFATHDINLLDRKIIRRDQVWFTEKNKNEETDLYSLVEYKPRNDTSYEKGYISGKYGAIPYVDLDCFIKK